MLKFDAVALVGNMIRYVLSDFFVYLHIGLGRFDEPLLSFNLNNH